VLVLCGQMQEKNPKCRVTNVGVWGRSPQPPEAKRSGGRAPAFGDFYNFLMKITRFYAY